MTAVEAFEFADQIQFYYHKPTGTGINDVLLRSLGKDGYIQFCKNMQRKTTKVSFTDKVQNFSEDFVKNPVETQCIVTDKKIVEQWTLSTIMDEVKKLV